MQKVGLPHQGGSAAALCNQLRLAFAAGGAHAQASVAAARAAAAALEAHLTRHADLLLSDAAETLRAVRRTRPRTRHRRYHHHLHHRHLTSPPPPPR